MFSDGILWRARSEVIIAKTSGIGEGLLVSTYVAHVLLGLKGNNSLSQNTTLNKIGPYISEIQSTFSIFQ